MGVRETGEDNRYYMIIADQSHFDLDYYGGSGFRITPEVNGESAVVSFDTYSVGEAEKIVVSIAGVGETELALETADGKTYGKGSIDIANVHRWDGVDDPYLYEATAVLYRGGEAVDAVADRFGCREFRFDAKEGFFLNGRRYPLHGVSRHQDRLGVGNMGLQVAAIEERYKRQMMAKMNQMQTQGLEGTAQIGMNFNTMMENMQLQKQENKDVFGTEEPQNFVSGRTAEGDILVMRAHQAAKKAMKAAKPELQIGLSLSLHDIQAAEGGEENALHEWDGEFSHYVPYILDDDFFGLQNYTRSIIGADGIQPVPQGAETTQMDYEFYPEALEHVIRRVSKEFSANGKEMPIMVTENGIATEDDTRRVAFIGQATDGVASCIQSGIPVIGYMYWSLMDNFEWQKGFSMKFGLIAVDRATQERMPKPSLTFLGKQKH